MKYFFLIIPLFFILENTFCQTADLFIIASCGGQSQSNGIIMEWTLGEGFTDYKTGNNIKLQEGFHQGDLSVKTSVSNIPENIGIDIFPNPVEAILHVSFTGISNGDSWHFELFSSQGVLIKKSSFTDSNAAIDLSDLPASSYLIKVINNQGKYKVFSVVKQ